MLGTQQGIAAIAERTDYYRGNDDKLSEAYPLTEFRRDLVWPDKSVARK